MAEQASEMAGFPKPREGTFVWTEVATNDAEKSKAFFAAVFGWKFKDGNAGEGMPYHEFSTGGGNPAGGLYEIDPKWFEGQPQIPPPHFMNYIAVDDIDANAEKAKQLGATILKGPMDIPNVGRFAIIQDPTGAVFATFGMK